MVEQAMATARTLLVSANDAGPQSEERRSFVKHLITLPSYRNQQATQFFSNFVKRYFSEFEDLQDGAVDAVLDLCEDEDEETRILGIQGLGSTAKADPRWVRGNAGVLLQLLECPERELKEVKKVLIHMLQNSPIPVFGVMADDCKGSEEETGASRHNIIDYLYRECGTERRNFLESGRNTAAEEIFRTGFMEVLKTATKDEAKMVLEMLVPLSTISGPTAKPETTNAFARRLTDSISSQSKSREKHDYVRMFAKLAERAPAVGGRAGLYFLSKHGEAVVVAILDKKDKAVAGLMKPLRGWVDELLKLWDRGGQEQAEGDLVRDCCEPMLEEVFSWLIDRNTIYDDLASNGAVIEEILYPVYKLIRFRDRRREIVHSLRVRDLSDIIAGAEKVRTKYPAHSVMSRCISNIGKITKILSVVTERFEDISPSWVVAPPTPPQRLAPAPARPPVIAAYQPRAPAGARATAATTPPLPLSSRFPAPAAPRVPPTAPSGPRGSLPLAAARIPPSGPSSTGPRVPSNPSIPSGPRAATFPTPAAKAASAASIATAIDLTADDIEMKEEPSSGPSSNQAQPLSAVRPTLSSPNTQRLNNIHITSQSGPGPIIPKPPTFQPTISPSAPVPAASTSGLASRMGPVKRQREGYSPEPQSSAQPQPRPSMSTSLSSRIGNVVKTEEPEMKRSRAAEDVKLTLSDRLRKGNGAGSPSSSFLPPFPTFPTSESDIKPSISIKSSTSPPTPSYNRFGSDANGDPSSSSTAATSVPITKPTGTFSILGRSAVDASPAPKVEEIEYNKKGRGLPENKPKEEAGFVPPPSRPIPALVAPEHARPWRPSRLVRHTGGRHDGVFGVAIQDLAMSPGGVPGLRPPSHPRGVQLTGGGQALLARMGVNTGR